MGSNEYPEPQLKVTLTRNEEAEAGNLEPGTRWWRLGQERHSDVMSVQPPWGIIIRTCY